MEKEKKKTLTISSSLKKKIDPTSLKTSNKKSFSPEKKNLLDPKKYLTNLYQQIIQILNKVLNRKIMKENS